MKLFCKTAGPLDKAAGTGKEGPGLGLRCIAAKRVVSYLTREPWLGLK